MVILEAFIRYLIPTTVVVGAAVTVAHYGVGKSLKYMGAALWSAGESWEQGVTVARRVYRETFREGVESI